MHYWRSVAGVVIPDWQDMTEAPNIPMNCVGPSCFRTLDQNLKCIFFCILCFQHDIGAETTSCPSTSVSTSFLVHSIFFLLVAILQLHVELWWIFWVVEKKKKHTSGSRKLLKTQLVCTFPPLCSPPSQLLSGVWLWWFGY